MAKPWDKLSDETPEAYTRFLVYRNLGPSRSLDRAYAQVNPDAVSKRGKPRASGQWVEDSSKYRWTERAAAWDIENLLIHGQQVIVNYMAALSLYSKKLVEALQEEGKGPKDWHETQSGIGFLGGLISPEAPERLYSASRDDSDDEPASSGDGA